MGRCDRAHGGASRANAFPLGSAELAGAGGAQKSAVQIHWSMRTRRAGHSRRASPRRTGAAAKQRGAFRIVRMWRNTPGPALVTHN